MKNAWFEILINWLNGCAFDCSQLLNEQAIFAYAERLILTLLLVLLIIMTISLLRFCKGDMYSLITLFESNYWLLMNTCCTEVKCKWRVFTWLIPIKENSVVLCMFVMYSWMLILLNFYINGSFYHAESSYFFHILLYWVLVSISLLNRFLYIYGSLDFFLKVTESNYPIFNFLKDSSTRHNIKI